MLADSLENLFSMPFPSGITDDPFLHDNQSNNDQSLFLLFSSVQPSTDPVEEEIQRQQPIFSYDQDETNYDQSLLIGSQKDINDDEFLASNTSDKFFESFQKNSKPDFDETESSSVSSDFFKWIQSTDPEHTEEEILNRLDLSIFDPSESDFAIIQELDFLPSTEVQTVGTLETNLLNATQAETVDTTEFNFLGSVESDMVLIPEPSQFDFTEAEKADTVEHDWSNVEELEMFAIKFPQLTVMQVTNQPHPFHHPRYESDGKRRTEQSRTNPLEIQLPLLNQQLMYSGEYYLELVLTTNDMLYMHPNILKYHDKTAVQRDSGCVQIPLTKIDFLNGFKRLPHISIIRQKRDNFNMVLKDLDGKPVEEISTTNTKKEKHHALAKDFMRKYDLLKCRITCRLLIKLNGEFHVTSIKCCTNTIEEIAPQSKKRALSENSEDSQEKPQPSKKAREANNSKVSKVIDMNLFG